MNFAHMFRTAPADRVLLVKKGMSAKTVRVIAKRMAVPEAHLVRMLGLSRAAVNRKVRQNKPLSIEESSRVLGIGSLIGQVQVMVEESGNAAGFNAAEWTAAWLNRPVPALGWLRPMELMDTFDGQALVSVVVARMQSGAYG
nr:antitoxin Xre/MbcA/ParS toxin-binding domain-containing protein [uncultured Roseateles sp.]